MQSEKEKLLDIVNQLTGKTLIVEGKKDQRVLKTLGLNKVVMIAGRSLYQLPLIINQDSEVVILTDFDKKGRQLSAKLKLILSKHKIKVNNRLRQLFLNLGKTRVEDFKLLSHEIGNGYDMDSLRNSIRGDFNVKVSSKLNEIHNKSPDKSKGRNR